MKDVLILGVHVTGEQIKKAFKETPEDHFHPSRRVNRRALVALIPQKDLNRNRLERFVGRPFVQVYRMIQTYKERSSKITNPEYKEIVNTISDILENIFNIISNENCVLESIDDTKLRRITQYKQNEEASLKAKKDWEIAFLSKSHSVHNIPEKRKEIGTYKKEHSVSSIFITIYNKEGRSTVWHIKNDFLQIHRNVRGRQSRSHFAESIRIGRFYNLTTEENLSQLLSLKNANWVMEVKENGHLFVFPQEMYEYSENILNILKTISEKLRSSEYVTEPSSNL